jgi:sugar/nucleoside kinase (ribokinase family)
MSLLIAGTLCIDTIETPTGKAERVLGGSGAFSAVAASFFARPRLVSAVGTDFPPQHRELLATRRISLDGVQTLDGVPTQFWHGRYHAGLHVRDHIAVDMDIFDSWKPVVPETFRDSSYVFLAQMPPNLQHAVLDQVQGTPYVLADTIDYWIRTRREEVTRLFSRASAVVINDGEAELFTGEQDVLRASRAIRQLGPQLVIVKKGEHGVIVHTHDHFYALPALPTEDVIDPTGAGDTFAGAFIASLSAGYSLKRAVAAGIVTASFAVEDFGLSRLTAAPEDELNRRINRYREMLSV